MQKEQRRRGGGISLRTGVLFLTVANLFVKVLGFVYKVPLNALLGDEMASVNAATAWFAVLYTATAAGIPGALSVSVSRARAMGDRERIRALFSTTLRLLLFVGLLVSLALLLLSRPLSGEGGDSKAYLCMIAIAPALFFTSATGVLRGFFQGFSNLVPTAVSEVLEALGKAVFGVLLALLSLRVFKKERVTAAALAVFGITLGVILGACYLALLYRRHGRRLLLTVGMAKGREAPRTKEALHSVFVIAFPITLGAALMSLSGVLDAQMMRPLLTRYYGDAALAKSLYSDYSTGAVTLYNLPAVLVTPIAAALIPYLSGAQASGREERARRVTAAAIKLAAIVALPSAFGLSAFAAPILSFIFRSDGNMSENAGPALSVLAFCVFFAAILTITSAALQAGRKERLPLIALGVGICVKFLLMRLLVPRVGTIGVPLSTLGFFVTAALFNLLFLLWHSSLRLRWFDSLLRPLLCAFFSIGLGRMSYTGILAHAGADLSLVLTLLLSAALYLAFLIVFRAVGEDELALLPFGKKLSPFFIWRKRADPKGENSQTTHEK